jgi:rhamnosyltransferase
METFNKNPNIGIIISDIPEIFFNDKELYFPAEKSVHRKMLDLWEKMKCKKQIDFTKMSGAIFPVGTMFWYRPAALQPLFDLHLTSKDIPAEPVVGSILFAIERLPVYIAWNENYDYRIAVPEPPNTSAFAHNIQRNKNLLDLKNSKPYLLGQLLLSFPKAIKKLLKRTI